MYTTYNFVTHTNVQQFWRLVTCLTLGDTINELLFTSVKAEKWTHHGCRRTLKFSSFHRDFCWHIWVFPKIMVSPKASILIGFSIINPSILGYPYFWKFQVFTVIFVGVVLVGTCLRPQMAGRFTEWPMFTFLKVLSSRDRICWNLDNHLGCIKYTRLCLQTKWTTNFNL